MRASEAVERSLAVVDAKERDVRAWVELGPELARRAAADVDQLDSNLPLRGTTFGAKDVFDSAELPTRYGSVIFERHRPTADASAVALLRRAGSVLLGKTVTTEFALYQPGPTRNPWRLTHTPGGSSSGSAAAVASGMVDIALGTQTAGSVIRPASFCGVWGFKPTFGDVSVAGVKLIAPTLDTVGWFARSADLIDATRGALTGSAPARRLGAPPRIGLVRTEQWDLADASSQAAVLEAARLASAAGAAVVDDDLPGAMHGLADRHPVIHSFEAAQSLAWEFDTHADNLSEQLRAMLDEARSISAEDYRDARQCASAARRAEDELFDNNDVLLTPAVTGEAPEGLTSTGDPRFARLWTLLGWPAVSVPGLHGATGLPVGVQLVGRPGDDATLISCARWLADAFPGSAT